MPRPSTHRTPQSLGILLALLFVALGATGEEIEAEFTFRGQPIAPQCLEPFSTGGAEAPASTTIIDLESCTATTASPPAWESGRDGQRWFHRRADGRDGGSFGYRYRGRTSDGLAVLETWDNGGGSGIYSAVLLLRLEASRLVLVRSIHGGDRCTAGISQARVEGSGVIVDFRIGAADLVGLADDLPTAGTDETPELDLGAGPPNDCEGALRYRYAPATSAERQLLGIDFRPTDRILRGDSTESRCLRKAFGAAAFLDRPRLRRAAEDLRTCLEAGETR